MPGDMVEVLAEKVVAAGQSLLRTVAELKRRALLADAAAVNSAVEERSERYGQAAGATKAALRALRDEVSSTVQARSWRFESQWVSGGGWRCIAGQARSCVEAHVPEQQAPKECSAVRSHFAHTPHAKDVIT